MELKLFSQLYQRIQMDPSILLLGQNYLSLGNGHDLIWEKLCNDIYPELNLSPHKANYPVLWNECVKSFTDADRVMNQIAEAGRNIPPNLAIATILSLRWSLLYTSAIDETDAMVTDKGCSILPMDEKVARPKYRNKNRRWLVALCGNKENPPVLSKKFEQKSFNKQIADKIAWISNTYLEHYGVLVIDGLDPDCDWLNDENLFDQLVDLPLNSIYWFSAPKHLGECAEMLVEQGIMVVEPDGFYEHIQQHMPELLEYRETEDENEVDHVLYTALTLKMKGQATQTIQIRRSDISDITGENLCILDDEAQHGNPFSEKNHTQRFAEFLIQDGLPKWGLFNSKAGENSFYISRDKDKELEMAVYKALKDTGINRHPVLLCGPSNSGKSMMLANLALSIARQHKHPVIYIRGDLLAGAEGRLQHFIDNWFCNTSRFGDERPERTVVIWDGGGLKRSERDYANLQKLLFNSNAQVVGSLYSSASSNAVKVDQNLSGNEEGRLRALLSSLGGNFCERFNKIIDGRRHAKVAVLKNSSFLYLLQALFKYEFDGEYKSLREILKKQFHQEKEFAEHRAGQTLEEYVDEFFKAQATRAKHGIASSYQEKLQLLLDRMVVQERENSNSTAGIEEQKVRKYKELSERISAINGVLAIASEFGVQLPLSLLLKLLRDDRGNSYVALGEDARKIVDILRADTLIDFSYKSHAHLGEAYYVSFRNSIEAENYICLLCDLPLEDHSQARKEREVELLMQIIQEAESEMERWSAIELARQFGPNGHGMLSELEYMHTQSDYMKYQDYWLDIADAIIEAFPDDAEAVLLHAHLTREFIRMLPPTEKPHFEENYVNARIRLATVLDKIESAQQDASEMQRDRLSIELCANYQQALHDSFNFVSYADIKKRIRNAFQRSKKREGTDFGRDLSSNSMLDILLNAYEEYRKASQANPPAGIDPGGELAEILSDIDEMLDLEEFVYVRTNHELLGKVKKVYDLLGDGTLQMNKLEEKLYAQKSDAYIYLRARLIWQGDIPFRSDVAVDPVLEFCVTDRYMAICKDFPHSKSGDAPAELWDQIKRDAESAVIFLEDNADKIKKMQSERCIAMLLRAKWFLKTGTPMLASYQYASLTRNDWDEIRNLCRQYITYHNSGSSVYEPFIPAYFLSGVYEWIYGNAKEAVEYFNEAKSRCDFQTRSVVRLVLCAEGTSNPRTFTVRVQQNESRKYTAKIVRETSQTEHTPDCVETRYGMGVSEPVLRYLFDGNMPKEQQQNSIKDGLIRFNLIGAQVGSLQNGGDVQWKTN